MTCPRCRHENPLGAKFCVECASPLGRGCARCGTSLPPGARFCPQCAHPADTVPTRAVASPEAYTPNHLAERILDSRAAIEGERKQVTVLFADMKGSMELLADRDPEDARRIVDPVCRPPRSRRSAPATPMRSSFDRSRRSASTRSGRRTASFTRRTCSLGVPTLDLHHLQRVAAEVAPLVRASSRL
jgi:hypothetical protein